MLLEVCVNSAMSAVEAQKGGADRVELCENLHDGGTTPSAGTIVTARRELQIGLFVMIRPRGGDFLYSPEEFSIMEEDVRMARLSGADGVVFGILTADGRIDTLRMKRLIDIARPMGVTCHRAFDMTCDPFEAMETLITLGVDRILTSGQQPTAPLGADLIRQLINQSHGRIIIMPGSGIRIHNVKALIQATGATEFHVHPDRKVSSRMIFRRPTVSMGNPQQDEYEYTITDYQMVEKFREEMER
jgi:copper homeostasis protein